MNNCGTISDLTNFSISLNINSGISGNVVLDNLSLQAVAAPQINLFATVVSEITGQLISGNYIINGNGIATGIYNIPIIGSGNNLSYYNNKTGINCINANFTGLASGWGGYNNLTYATGIITVNQNINTTGVGYIYLGCIASGYIYQATGIIPINSTFNVFINEIVSTISSSGCAYTTFNGLTGLSNDSIVYRLFDTYDIYGNISGCNFYSFIPTGIFSGNLNIQTNCNTCGKPYLAEVIPLDSGSCPQSLTNISEDINTYNFYEQSTSWIYENQENLIGATDQAPPDNDPARIIYLFPEVYAFSVTGQNGTTGIATLMLNSLGTGFNPVSFVHTTSQDAWASYNVTSGMTSKIVSAFTIDIISGISGYSSFCTTPFIVFEPISFGFGCIQLPGQSADNNPENNNSPSDNGNAKCLAQAALLWQTVSTGGSCANAITTSGETTTDLIQPLDSDSLNPFNANLTFNDIFSTVFTGVIFYNNPCTGDGIYFNSYNFDYPTIYQQYFGINPPYKATEFALIYPYDFTGIEQLATAINNKLSYTKTNLWVSVNGFLSGTTGIYINTPLLSATVSGDQINIVSLAPGPMGNFNIQPITGQTQTKNTSAYLIPQTICLQGSNDSINWTNIYCESGIDWTQAQNYTITNSFVINSADISLLFSTFSGSNVSDASDNADTLLLQELQNDPTTVLCTVSGAWKLISQSNFASLVCNQDSNSPLDPNSIANIGTSACYLINNYSGHLLSGCPSCLSISDNTTYNWPGLLLVNPNKTLSITSNYYIEQSGFWFPAQSGQTNGKLLFNGEAGGANLFWDSGIQNWILTVECLDSDFNEYIVWSGNKVTNLDLSNTSTYYNSYAGIIASEVAYSPSGVYQRFGGCDISPQNLLLVIDACPIGLNPNSIFNIGTQTEYVLKTGYAGTTGILNPTNPSQVFTNNTAYDYYRIHVSNFTSGDLPEFQAKHITLFQQKSINTNIPLTGNPVSIIGANYSGTLFSFATGYISGYNGATLTSDNLGTQEIFGYVQGIPSTWVSLYNGNIDSPIPTGYPYFVSWEDITITGTGYYSLTFTGYFYDPITTDVYTSVTFGTYITGLGIISGQYNQLDDLAISEVLTNGVQTQVVLTTGLCQGIIIDAPFTSSELLSFVNTGIWISGTIYNGSGSYLINEFLTGIPTSAQFIYPTGYIQATGDIIYNNPQELDNVSINNNTIYYSTINESPIFFNNITGLVNIINSGNSIYDVTATQNGNIISLTAIPEGTQGNIITLSSSSTGAFEISNSFLISGQNLLATVTPSGIFSNLLNTIYTNTGFYYGSGTGLITGYIPIWWFLRTFTGVWGLATGDLYSSPIDYQANDWISGANYTTSGILPPLNFGSNFVYINAVVTYNNIPFVNTTDIVALCASDSGASNSIIQILGVD